MHVAYLCWFQVIWSCWRANWKKRTWSCQTTRPPWSSRGFTTSTDHSTPWSRRRPQHFSSPPDPLVEYRQERHSITPLDPLVKYHHLHHFTFTRSHYSTSKPSTIIFITRLHTRLPASESSSFRTQPDTREQGRKEDSSLSLDLSLDHLGRVQFLIRPNTASFWILGFQNILL